MLIGTMIQIIVFMIGNQMKILVLKMKIMEVKFQLKRSKQVNTNINLKEKTSIHKEREEKITVEITNKKRESNRSLADSKELKRDRSYFMLIKRKVIQKKNLRMKPILLNQVMEK